MSKSNKWKFNKDKTRITYEDHETYVKAQDFTAHTEDVESDMKRNRAVVDMMFKINPSIKSFLDVGCREGLMVEHLDNKGIEVIGIDISPTSVSYACQKGRNVRQGDAHKIEEQFERKFDAILSVHSLEHCHSPEVVLGQCYRLLNENGLIGIRVPIHSDLSDQSFKTSRTTKGEGGLPAHASLFSYESLKSILEEAGFGVIYSKPDRQDHPRYAEHTFIGERN